MPSSSLTEPQFCLGFSRDEMTATAGGAGLDLVIAIGGVDYTTTLDRPGVGGYFRCDRTGGASDMAFILQEALDSAESQAATGRSWTLEWDYQTEGYVRWVRDAAGATVEIKFDAAGTDAKVNPAWWGFDPDAANPSITAIQTSLASTWQAGRLWLPREPPSEWPWQLKRKVEVSRRPHDGRVRRHKYGQMTEWRVEFERIDGLKILKSHAEKPFMFPSWATSVAAGDENISFEGAIWEPLFDTDSPIYFYPDKDDVEVYELELYRQEDFEDLEAIWRAVGLEPMEYDGTLMMQVHVP